MMARSSNRLPGELTEMQKKFCKEYVKDFNQTQTAIRAGYGKKNAKVMGSRLMANPLVTGLLVEIRKDIANNHDTTVDGIILNLKNLRNKCFESMDHAKNGPAYAMVALKAIELMGQHIGMWPKRIELDHNFKIDQERQAENETRVFEILDRIAVAKSNSDWKTPRLVKGGKTKTTNPKG